ncbi:hypothetical protein ACSLVQ_27540, partial [Klebsiella pneumoniae]|uniref:hypothetical protein n=1 Tax=Klebsiella pneumoniae TaxID=573 RepID=UPI003EDE85EC
FLHHFANDQRDDGNETEGQEQKQNSGRRHEDRHAQILSGRSLNAFRTAEEQNERGDSERNESP